MFFWVMTTVVLHARTEHRRGATTHCTSHRSPVRYSEIVTTGTSSPTPTSTDCAWSTRRATIHTFRERTSVSVVLFHSNPSKSSDTYRKEEKKIAQRACVHASEVLRRTPRMQQQCVHVVLWCSRWRHTPHLEPDTLERGSATTSTVRAGAGKWVVVKRRTARGGALVERLVKIEPIMPVPK